MNLSSMASLSLAAETKPLLEVSTTASASSVKSRTTTVTMEGLQETSSAGGSGSVAMTRAVGVSASASASLNANGNAKASSYPGFISASGSTSGRGTLSEVVVGMICAMVLSCLFLML